METDFFLLHQFGIGTIVDNIFAKDRSCQRCVYLLRIDVFQLSIEYKLVTLRAQTDSGLLAEKNECKDVAVLEPSQFLFFI